MNYDKLQEIASKIREMDYDSLVSVVDEFIGRRNYKVK